MAHAQKPDFAFRRNGRVHLNRRRRQFIRQLAAEVGTSAVVQRVRNLTAHAQKPNFVFRLNGRVHLNRWGSQFSRMLAVEVCASALVLMDTPRSDVV